MCVGVCGGAWCVREFVCVPVMEIERRYSDFFIKILTEIVSPIILDASTRVLSTQETSTSTSTAHSKDHDKLF